jgi:succinate dehydrogenase / fumarate reductase cytochrome b subunit
MFTSIAHRATGIGLYLGALLLAGWAVALGLGPDAYAGYKHLLGSPVGKLVLLGLTVSIFYHLAAGVRHLVWDAGWGFSLKSADAGSWIAIVFALVATVAVWVIAAGMGAL